MNAKVKRGTTLLHRSAQRGYRKLVKVLIAAGADVDAKDRNGKSPLHLSAERGYSKIVKLLIAAGADVNAEDRFGETPLHLNGEQGHSNIAEALIAAGADVNAKDKIGKTLLHYSVEHDHWSIVGVLITAGAEINARDIILFTPLHYSVQCEDSDIAKTLIAAGADVNAKDVFGRNPLHRWSYVGNLSLNRSSRQEFIEILKSLITANVDVNMEDDNRKTPLDIIDDNTEVLICMIKYIILHTVSPKTPILKKSIYMINEMWHICEQQVKELKETFLGNSNVSLFEFLVETSENKTALYSSEESFGMKTAMNSDSYFEKFPLFTEDIRFKFLKGNKRADLLFKNQTLLKKHSIFTILPTEIVRKITEYLEVEDLIKVLRALTFKNPH